MLKNRIDVYSSVLGKYTSDERYIYVNVFITKFSFNRLNLEKTILETAKMAGFRINHIADDGFSVKFTKGTVWARNELLSELQRYAQSHNMDIEFCNFYRSPLEEK